jgi:hypothetical protein
MGGNMSKLITERNLPAVGNAIREEFEASDLCVIAEHLCEPFFEHGQWWVSCGTCGASWSVVDTNKGFYFKVR